MQCFYINKQVIKAGTYESADIQMLKLMLTNITSPRVILVLIAVMLFHINRYCNAGKLSILCSISMLLRPHSYGLLSNMKSI